MADGRPPMGDTLASPHDRDDAPGIIMVNNRDSEDNEGSSPRDAPNGSQIADTDATPSLSTPTATFTGGNPPTQMDPALTKQVSEVLSSEIGIATLLTRLKQSVSSAKEYAQYLKKRSSHEDDHAQSLKKLSRSTQESMRRPDHREGSFARIYDEMMFIHERMAENGIQFSLSLQQMHEDLLDLANATERHRKTWKANGLAAEQKVADLEQTMRKSKAKYDSLAEDYDRARTGEPRQGGKVFGAFKGSKSAAQYEEDLLRKVEAADSTYRGHVQNLQSEKTQLERSTRPEAVKALQELIREIDSGVALQMQKFAAFNEKLLLSNGLIISPLRGQAAELSGQPRSLRSAVSSINNDRDLNEFVAAHRSKVPPNTGEVRYEKNPVLTSGKVLLPPSGFGQTSGPQAMSQGPAGMHPPQPVGQGPAGQFQGPPSQQSFGMATRSSTGFNSQGGPGPSPQGPPGQPPSNIGPGGPQDGKQPYAPHNRSFSQSNMQGPPGGPPPQQQNYGPGGPGGPGSGPPQQRYGNGGPMSPQGPPQLGALSFQGGHPQQFSSGGPPGGPYQQPPQHDRSVSGPMSMGGPMGGPQAPPSAPTKPVFGISLTRLYERDGLAVPMVVHQSIQAVDLFGLGLEGIYRQSGSMTHIQKLKSMFDTESQNPALDFRNPENFYHDVNSVTGLLKQFFRDLPDPLFTNEHHNSFINAAKQEDDIVRRDSLHAIINSLPDPNYATMRALCLHLYRVMENSHVNRMNSHNLAVIFGPTLMGTDPSNAIADAGWQIKAIDTVLQNTYQIFDED